jgi:hypothetical protein
LVGFAPFLQKKKEENGVHPTNDASFGERERESLRKKLTLPIVAKLQREGGRGKTSASPTRRPGEAARKGELGFKRARELVLETGLKKKAIYFWAVFWESGSD